MEKLRTKIKVKHVSKSKEMENGQSGATPESLPRDYVIPNASADHGNGFFPMLAGGIKRKRVHKVGSRREESKYLTSPHKTISIPSFHEEVEKFSCYENSEERIEDEEELRMGNATQYALGFHNSTSKPEEARNTEQVQYRQGNLRVKLNPSKFKKLSANLSNNDKNNFVSTFSTQKDKSSYVEPRRQSYTSASTPKMHRGRSEWSGAKISSSQLKPFRSLDGVNSPGQMRSGRLSEISSSPQQSEPVETVWKIGSQQSGASEILEEPLKKDNRPFLSTEKGGRCLSPFNQKELEAALRVVKKIMRMDAAEPFNTPVDPVALGIPDYFDVIDTPMDLGTICCALEKGEKYRTSKDVFHEVQLVWDNCIRYNRKGDLILELMRKVKKNFIKYWTAAGLYYESSKRSGTMCKDKVDTPTNIEDGDRIKEYEPKYLAANINNGNINDSKTEKNKIRLCAQPSPESLLKSEATQNVLTSTRSMERQRNPHHDDFESLELQQCSKDLEARTDISQRSHEDATAKKKGIKVVFKNSMPIHDPQEKFVEERNAMPDFVEERNVMPDCISVGTDEQSGSKPGDFDRSFQEETRKKDMGIKMKSHGRHRIHHHKPGCLCAVCVSKRRKHAREGKVPLISAQSTISNVNASETLNEEPAEIEIEQEMDKMQELKERSGDIERVDERSHHGEEALEAQENGQLQEEKAEIQEDLEKDSSGKHYSTDFKFPLQNTSPSISRMGTVLFETWNWPHSLAYRPSRESSDNPILSAISSFMN